jgi:Tol biopolymer transport system component
MGLSLLSGCAGQGTPAGIYAVPVKDGVSTWVGEPAAAPTWSPTGEILAWGSEDGLSIANLENGSTRVLTTTPVAGRPAWSPDGKAIAYMDERGQSLTIVNASNGTETADVPVATESRWSSSVDLESWGSPSWSGDGSRIAFACWDGAGDELCVANSDGSQRRQITRLGPATNAATDPGRIATATSNIGAPAWAPDGSTIAVAAYPERSGAPAGLFLVDLDRGTARQLSKLLPNSEITWEPDGSALVFSATEKGRSDVVRVGIKDGEAAKLTTRLTGGARSPALSPDGKRIAAISQGALIVLDEDGSVSTFPGLTLKEAFPAWSAGGDVIAVSAKEDPIAKYD